MMDNNHKSSLSDFTCSEFISFVEDVSDSRGRTEAEDDAMVAEFDRLVPNPRKNGLLFWPDEGADDSSQGIALEIERYCIENGLPAFKDSPKRY